MRRHFEVRIRRGMMELLKDQTLDEVTVKNLTELTGLSKQAFYYHASNIPEYLCKRIAQLTKTYAEECGDNINLLPDAARKAMEYLREIRPISSGMMSSEHKLEYLYAINESIHKEVRNAVIRHLAKFRMDFDKDRIRRISDHFADAVYGLIRTDLLEGMSGDPEEICSEYKKMVGRAISIIVENYF